MSEQEPCQPSTTRAYSIQGNTIDRDAKQGGGGVSRDVSYTLDAVDRHGVYAAGFSHLMGAKAHGIGYEAERSTTLNAARLDAVLTEK